MLVEWVSLQELVKFSSNGIEQIDFGVLLLSFKPLEYASHNLVNHFLTGSPATLASDRVLGWGEEVIIRWGGDDASLVVGALLGDLKSSRGSALGLLDEAWVGWRHQTSPESFLVCLEPEVLGMVLGVVVFGHIGEMTTERIRRGCGDASAIYRRLKVPSVE